jgi:two-component sensor histidine kinase
VCWTPIPKLPLAIYACDAEGRVLWYNTLARKLWGRVPRIGDDTEKYCGCYRLHFGGKQISRDETQTPMAFVLRTGEAVHGAEGKVERPDGSTIWATLHIDPVVDEAGRQCPMAISLKEGRAVRGVEAVAERPDGSRVPFIPYPTPMRDARGRVVGGINMLVDISERKQAETQQNVLLNELNHRVKNNMQMLQSLLFASARQSRSEEARRTLEDASSRVAAMAAAQRVLCDTTAANFSAPELLAAVCQTAQQTFPSHITISTRADPGELTNDIAMPVALILNELLTNAVKHGTNGHADTIRVSLLREASGHLLTVEDDGPGFDLDEVLRKSSGLRLVDGLSRQLRGTFTVSRGSATRCSLRFP